MSLQFQPAPGWLPPGHRVYAVGDVHGCAARLAALHRQIAADLAARPVAQPLLIHLGDYVDRGPDSAGVLALLLAGPPVPGLPVVNLMGNHERTMLDALAGERAAITDWRFHGGREALASWGLEADSDPAGWAVGIPSAQRAFVAGLALSHTLGGYFFAHAGVRPGLPLAAQDPEDLLRIRHAFLNSEAEFGAVVVHGHSPSRGPVVKPNRIGIDTGAVFGRELTCLVLEAERLAFLTA
ncbi:metallophosphoesterase [Siccirubricoccus phaeus]|uniref:metallophosphoesterase n=1 Tax=Siccirubricoccus phaeus TaxID=2595053 RepID=UPI0011F14779|nr:metallophosphoesterase [Siccirubricoccus phaeus]